MSMTLFGKRKEQEIIPAVIRKQVTEHEYWPNGNQRKITQYNPDTGDIAHVQNHAEIDGRITDWISYLRGKVDAIHAFKYTANGVIYEEWDVRPDYEGAREITKLTVSRVTYDYNIGEGKKPIKQVVSEHAIQKDLLRTQNIKMIQKFVDAINYVA